MGGKKRPSLILQARTRLSLGTKFRNDPFFPVCHSEEPQGDEEARLKKDGIHSLAVLAQDDACHIIYSVAVSFGVVGFAGLC